MSTLEYCNGFGPVCFNTLSPSFEDWTSGSHAIASASTVTDHQRLRLHWAHERHHWHAEWQNIVFLDESRFNMSYNDGRIRVWLYAGECNLRAWILQWHRGPTPNGMVWGIIGYNMRSHFLRIESNLNSSCYIREILQPEVLPLLLATPHAIFQQDNAQSHVTRIMQAFCKRWWYHCFPGLHVRQTCHPSNMSGIWFVSDTLRAHIQTAWRDIPQEDIQVLFDSMPWCIENLIAAHGGFTSYWNHMLIDHVQFCNSNCLSIAMYLICGIHYISVTCLLLGVAIFTNSTEASFVVSFSLSIYHCSISL